MTESSGKNWYAIHTKYKAEKWVAEKLKKKGIHAYVPLLSKTKKYSKRVAHYQYALISCYCFVHISIGELNKVLQTEHVFDILRSNGKAAIISNKEIELIQRVVGDKLVRSAEITAKDVGEDVEVIAGAMTGLRGKLIDIQGKKQFIVALKQLGYQLNINIDPAHLQVLDSILV